MSSGSARRGTSRRRPSPRVCPWGASLSRASNRVWRATAPGRAKGPRVRVAKGCRLGRLARRCRRRHPRPTCRGPWWPSCRPASARARKCWWPRPRARGRCAFLPDTDPARSSKCPTSAGSDPSSSPVGDRERGRVRARVDRGSGRVTGSRPRLMSFAERGPVSALRAAWLRTRTRCMGDLLPLAQCWQNVHRCKDRLPAAQVA
mmetsp:Transcript_13276/g.39113  ORF Transcript_13276/g.39113 Transcript_13276/m.39113 type:complete len:204 (-) Transcript_13276:112-723(-)